MFKQFLIYFLALLQIKIAPKVVNNEHKDDSITKDSEHPKNESSDINSFATPEELERGKLPPEEILSLPMFKVSISKILLYFGKMSMRHNQIY